MSVEVKVPRISEDADTGIVAEIYVEEGDTIEEGQNIIALDSDKASVDVPSDASGKVISINMQEGDEVAVGDVILILEESESENGEPEEGREKEKAEEKKGKAEQKKKTKEDSKKKEEDEEPSEKDTGEEPEKQPKPAAAEEEQEQELTPSAPLAKKFARELGIDISELETGDPEQRITREDVMEYARKIIKSKKEARPSGEPARGGITPIELPDFSKWGEVERQPFSPVRSATAEKTRRSWQNMPHVTHHDKAELSELNDFRASMAQDKGQELSMTALITKVVAEALKKFPKFNASLDLDGEEIIFKKYYHISIAVDTDEGLLMPVIRDVDKKPIVELSEELNELAERARNRELNPAEMEGGNFAISNLGGIGGTAFTPVIFPPQAAILGVSTSETQAVFSGGKFEPREVLPLSLSYDHRLIDGAEAARFLRWVCEVIEQPMRLLNAA